MRFSALLFMLVLLCLPLIGSAQNVPVLSVYPYARGTIYVHDTTDFSVVDSVVVNVPGVTFEGLTGIARNDYSEDWFVIGKQSTVLGRTLEQVDIVTGNATTVGNLGDNFASIVFAGNRLFGVTGDGATVPESLFEINPTDATTTLVATLGSGNDGECISFCPDNGKLYHWSGRDTDPAMEVIDTATFTVDTISRSGYNYDEVFGAVYVGNGKFTLINLDQEIIVVDTSGFAVNTGLTTDNNYRGLALGDFNWQQTNIPFCDNDPDGGVLYVTTPAVSYQWFRNGSPIVGATNDSLMVMNGGDYSCYCTFGTFYDTTAEISITPLNVPIVVLSPNDEVPLCPGASVTLTGSSGGSSQWYFDGVAITDSTSNMITVSTTGRYNMAKTNLNGCTDTASVPAYVYNVPNPAAPDLGEDTILCDDQSLTLFAGTGYSSYLWNTSETTSSITLNGSSLGVGSYNISVEVTDSNGCSNDSEITVTFELCSGIGGTNALPISLYPNPATDKLRLEIPVEANSRVSLNAYDMLGREVLSLTDQDASALRELEVKDWLPGQYILRLQIDREYYQASFIKQ